MGEGRSAEEQVRGLLFSIFEAAKNKDFAFLNRMHASDDSFSKFDDNLPHTRQDSKQASMYEEVALANISDYSYKIEELKIDILGDVALTTFYLQYKGMFVNNYTFEGKSVEARSRVTMVFQKRRAGWVIVHEHLSRFQDA